MIFAASLQPKVPSHLPHILRSTEIILFMIRIKLFGLSLKITFASWVFCVKLPLMKFEAAMKSIPCSCAHFLTLLKTIDFLLGLLGWAKRHPALNKQTRVKAKTFMILICKWDWNVTSNRKFIYGLKVQHKTHYLFLKNCKSIVIWDKPEIFFIFRLNIIHLFSNQLPPRRITNQNQERRKMKTESHEQLPHCHFWCHPKSTCKHERHNHIGLRLQLMLVLNICQEWDLPVKFYFIEILIDWNLLTGIWSGTM